jgi:hypothetical protein
MEALPTTFRVEQATERFHTDLYGLLTATLYKGLGEHRASRDGYES